MIRRVLRTLKVLFFAVAILSVSASALIFTPTIVEAQSCTTPAQVQNVLVTFPNCQGDVCTFTEANCTWNAVSGAASYSVSVSVVETGASVLNTSATTTSQTFAVASSNTYKCDVSAVNSCGTSGPAGSHSLLCSVDAAVTTTPGVSQNQCGYPCTSNAACQTGYTCAIGSSGQGYCAVPSYTTACQASPSVSTCCSAPVGKPTIPPAGNALTTVALSAGALIFIIIGLAFFLI